MVKIVFFQRFIRTLFVMLKNDNMNVNSTKSSCVYVR